MKLRSHEILSTNKNPIRTKNTSRFKQLFKKKLQQQQQQQQHGLIHSIPNYVRKSIFRFLVEVKTPTPPPPPPPPPPIRQTPLMGIRALKNNKRSIRTKQKETVVDHNKSIEDQQQNNYDMTILHMNIDDDGDDGDDDSLLFATKSSTNQKKQIPQWARKNELQIAICNQLYFHRNPSEIFGNTIDCSPSHLRTILHSMLPNVQISDDPLYQTSPCNSNKSILI